MTARDVMARDCHKEPSYPVYPVLRGFSVLSWAPLEYWIPAFAGMTIEGVARVFIRRSFAFPRRDAPEVLPEIFRP
jgi:hypothetical protein